MSDLRKSLLKVIVGLVALFVGIAWLIDYDRDFTQRERSECVTSGGAVAVFHGQRGWVCVPGDPR